MAVASDEPLDLDVPVLDLNAPRRSRSSSHRFFNCSNPPEWKDRG